MKVLTLNLNGYVEANRYEKLELVSEGIIEEDIDIICLQEVTQYYLEEIIYDDVKCGNIAHVLQLILKKQFNVDYELEIKMFENIHECYDEGVAILSKNPLKEVSSDRISAIDITDSLRYSLSGIYKDDDEDYQIICTHLNNPSTEPDYDLQVARLLNSVDLGGKVVICADMNVLPDSKEFSNIKAKGLYDIVSLTSKTVGSMATHLKYETRIDYILTNFSSITHAKALFTKKLVSDHIGVMIEL